MERFPPIVPSKLTPEQKEMHDEMLATADKVFRGKGFVYQRDDGAMVGPFAPLLYTPIDVARHFLGVVIALGSIKGLPSSAKEAAIITSGAYFSCAYERYAHEHVAESTGALTKDQIKSLSQGKKPSQADVAIATAYDVTMGLLDAKGPLDEALWQRARKEFGQEGAAALVHYVGSYAYTSILLNAANVPIPKR